MGSGSSKEDHPSPSTFSSACLPVRRRRRATGSLLASLCLASPSVLPDSQLGEENGGSAKVDPRITGEDVSKSNDDERNHESCEVEGALQASKVALLDSSALCNGLSNQVERVQEYNSSSSQSNPPSDTSQSSTSSSARFGLSADGITFPLNRNRSSIPSPREDGHAIANGHGHVNNTQTVLVNSLNNSNVVLNNIASNAASSNDISGSRSNVTELLQTEMSDRQRSQRHGQQEQLEGSVRLSRTRSVGRFRDRVLRSASYSDDLFSSMNFGDQSMRNNNRQGLARRALSHISRGSSYSNRVNNFVSDSSSLSVSRITNFMGSVQDYDSESPHYREAAIHDILERRSAFLERRRRIRSQVRALQPSGARSENLSGHEMSCTLSGQERTGHCTCRRNRTANHNEDTSTRASISRIVMLAEALFEVLDEIHQQSVALSTRPSLSTIGSVPAPKEVVDCLPVNVYMKPQKYKNEETAQCYICLVEYEPGDLIRMLPCRHEFHQMCIDKWLKEIHRVCPLCRGDVCRPSAPIGKL